MSPLVKRISWVWASALGVIGAAGLFLLGFALARFDAVRSFLDPIAADGSFERLTPQLYAGLQPFTLSIGVLLLALSIAAVIRRDRSQRVVQAVLTWLGCGWRAAPREGRALLRAVIPADASRVEGMTLLGIMLGALAARWLFLWQPMGHDESYTVIGYAVRSWGAVMSDYSLPNNHIFHTLLVKLSIQWFGMQPWAVRLPALLAGLLCVPMTYRLARYLYGAAAALLAAGVVAAWPAMVLYSTVARGYSLSALLTLLIFALALYLKDHPNRVGWLLLAVFTALGFYTFPIMLYPAGGVWLWIALTAVLGDFKGYRSRWHLLAWAMGAGILVIFGVSLAYAPVILYGTGWDSLVDNPFVRQVSAAAFPEVFNDRFFDATVEWRRDLPAILPWVGGLAMLVTTLGHSRWPRRRVLLPLLPVLLLWLVVILPIQRPNAMARTWTFMLPLAAVTMTGWLAIFNRKVALILALVGLLFLGEFSRERVLTTFPGLQTSVGEVEHVTQVLRSRWQPDDIIVIASDDSPILWYYSRLYGIPDRALHHLELHPYPFQRAWVVVSQRERQTLQGVITSRGLLPDEFNLDTARVAEQIGTTVIYECWER